MTLDLSQVSGQIDSMAEDLRAGVAEKAEHLLFSLQTVKSLDVDAWRQKFKDSKTTWLVAGLESSPALSYQLPALPAAFSVLGADGSQIDVDRHSPARCYLLNLGMVRLDYGAHPDARLCSQPLLYSKDDELVIRDLKNGREERVEGALLGIKRSVEECHQLARMAAELSGEQPALALLDGTLILWVLEGYRDFVTKELLDNGFLKALDDIKVQGQKGKLAFASYISHPRSTEVVNALRIALCPYQPVDCDRFCPGKGAAERKCDAVSGISDRELFDRLLKADERSAIFVSRSSVVQKHYGEHEVRFFYLKLDEEIARVEMPRWVSDDKQLLDLTHALVFDQCQRGQGYPVALSEAHEQAVVTGADRELFWQLVEQAMVDKHLIAQVSAKSRSKRTRWI